MSEKRKYLAEFRQKVVGLGYARGNASEVYQELGLNPSVLGRGRSGDQGIWPEQSHGQGKPETYRLTA